PRVLAGLAGPEGRPLASEAARRHAGAEPRPDRGAAQPARGAGPRVPRRRRPAHALRRQADGRGGRVSRPPPRSPRLSEFPPPEREGGGQPAASVRLGAAAAATTSAATSVARASKPAASHPFAIVPTAPRSPRLH